MYDFGIDTTGIDLSNIDYANELQIIANVYLNLLARYGKAFSK